MNLAILEEKNTKKLRCICAWRCKSFRVTSKPSVSGASKRVKPIKPDAARSEERTRITGLFININFRFRVLTDSLSAPQTALSLALFFPANAVVCVEFIFTGNNSKRVVIIFFVKSLSMQYFS